MACRDADADGIAFYGVGQCLVRQQARVTTGVARVAFCSAKGGASGMRTFRGAKRDYGASEQLVALLQRGLDLPG